MEAIVCPICGDGRVEMLTEEKYRCIACDNEFLVHNLSKEFRQTDAHISNMHQDLKNTVGSLGNTMGGAGGLDNLYKNGCALLRQGYPGYAWNTFEEICKNYAWSYKGYYGQLQVMLGYDVEGEYSKLPEYLERIKECDDYTEEVATEIEEALNSQKEYLLGELISWKEDSEAADRVTEELDSVTRQLEDEEQNKQKNELELKNKIKEQDNKIKEQDNRIKEAAATAKEKFEKNLKKSSIVTRVVIAALAAIAVFLMIRFAIILFSWAIIGTKELYREASSEGFINRIWQYLIYSIWGIIKIAISIALLCAGGYASYMGIFFLFVGFFLKEDQEVPVTEEEKTMREEKSAAEQEKLALEQELSKELSEVERTQQQLRDRKISLESEIERINYMKEQAEKAVSAAEEIGGSYSEELISWLCSAEVLRQEISNFGKVDEEDIDEEDIEEEEVDEEEES